ncbi:hypothetical protein MPSEU_000782700 [Mayamaea pseudoterrestris]|nr:hypothetical protein MPSEU_000782700 [Mayamaea pseudoterrestris]
MSTMVSQSDWAKGISLSVLASILGAASKMAIRKSWLLQESINERTTLEATEYYRVVDEVIEEEVAVGPVRRRISLGGSSTQSSSFEYAIVASESLDKRRLWPAYALRFGGMAGMSIFNPLCCVVAMNYASPSILAPFSGLTLVWIIVLSDALIHEKASFRQRVAAALIILGEIIVSLYGDHTNDQNVTVDDVRKSYSHAPFLLYFAGLSLWLAVMVRWMSNGNRAMKRFAWGVAGGSISGQQNFLKDALIVLKATRHHHSDSFHHHLPWWVFLLVALSITSAFSGLLLLTACMKRYDVTFSSAMFVGSFIVSTSLMSVVHYDTFQNLHSVTSCVLYPIGFLVLMSGVGMLVLEADDGNNAPLNLAAEDILANLQAPLISHPTTTTHVSSDIQSQSQIHGGAV